MCSLPKVPGYQLIEYLGGGAMSAVFSARSRASGEVCAVKMLHTDWWYDANALALLRREARVGLRTLSPHLIRILDAHVLRPPYFLVMPLIEGESVRDRLRREFALDLSTAIWIVRQVAEALDALHRAGCLHGDIKPENIRLVETGKAVLVDLGFAHQPGENDDLMSQGFVMGTANYIAPELCEADGIDDTPNDIYSLGITFFEMLTGQLPFAVGTVSETMVAHRDTPPRDLADLPGVWPPAIADILRDMVDRDPAARPNASSVVRRLMGAEISLLRRSA